MYIDFVYNVKILGLPQNLKDSIGKEVLQYKSFPSKLAAIRTGDVLADIFDTLNLQYSITLKNVKHGDTIQKWAN